MGHLKSMESDTHDGTRTMEYNIQNRKLFSLVTNILQVAEETFWSDNVRRPCKLKQSVLSKPIHK
jgi:hypothetical protein